MPLHDAELAGWFRNDTNELFQGLPVSRDDIVLDVGCGDGMIVSFCARRGAEILLADRDADKIAAAEKNLVGSGARSIRTIVSDCDPIPIPDETATVVISTEVLEHVDDLEGVLALVHGWLKPGGLMSHQFDLRSHRITKAWDGHRAFEPAAWRIVVGRRPYLINRLPYSKVIRAIENAGFEIIWAEPLLAEPTLSRGELSRAWRNVSEEDLRAEGGFVQARKR